MTARVLKDEESVPVVPAANKPLESAARVARAAAGLLRLLVLFLVSRPGLATPGSLAAQNLGSLVSPGPLAKPHAKLEGLDNCQKCHEPGKRVTATKCLECHKPIAQAIAAKKGVHREAAAACAKCHIEHAGVDADIRRLDTKTFDHKRESGFPLDGKHAGLDCAKCHKTRSFLNTKSDCAACHSDAHKGVLGAACASCHPVAVAFKETRKAFDHSKTKYLLTGAHATTGCEKCHIAKAWKGIRFAACVDCHKDPHAKPLGTCATCHTTATFKYVIQTAGNGSGTNGGAAAAGIAATGGAGAGSAAGAAAPPAKGGAAAAAAPAATRFDHARTGFPLVGRHAAVTCGSCHVQPATKVHLKFARCDNCHKDPHKGVFKTQDCASCHKETGWKPGAFDHAKTRFPLDGKHAPVPCASCHKGATIPPHVVPAKLVVDFRGARTECASCHVDVHKGKLGTTCEKCHSAVAWRLENYRHQGNPEFFVGGHTKVACDKCHAVDASAGSVALPKGQAIPVRVYKNVSLECATCHKDPHIGQVGRDCAACHSVQAVKYAPDRFDHSKTKYPLTGKHATVQCSRCHSKETAIFPAGRGTAVRLTGIAADCKTCHKDIHLGQLGVKCETCHATATFAVKGYKHQNKELAPFFVSKHATGECASCHKKVEGSFPAGPGTAVRFAGLPTSDCRRCHDDPHRGALGDDCQSCHTISKWQTASRAFHKTGSFPLEGQHLATPCAKCHWNNVYKGTPNTCFDCHWIRRQDDLYRTLLGSDCQNCHRPVSWTAVMWSHAAQTGYALTAPHANLRCDKCHTSRVFAGTPNDCYSCHRSDYLNARNPNHVSAGFPTTCETCHRPGDTSWHQATFTTHSTVFPLAGAHLTAPCASCHVNNNYTTVPKGPCAACHQTDYQNSKNPPHVAAGFSTACESCHRFSDATWKQATFTQHSSVFPLAGAHLTAPCASCHVNNNYTTVPKSPCAACHQTDFQKATTPVNHAGFPTACETCHAFSDTTWSQKTPFNHSAYFALAGAHTTAPCARCHVNNNYTTVPTNPCSACHMADYQNSKNPPHGSSGFPTACDTCHKFSDATWRQGTFLQHGTVFPLAGAHLTTACTNCHVNNNFTTVPKGPCTACHQTDFQKATTPVNHAGFPTACETCHAFSDTTWSQKTPFNHSAYFALAGAHVTATCASCHKNNNYLTVPTSPCSACHMTDYQTAISPVNHVASGLPTTCDSCHKFSDTRWGQATFAHTTFALAGVHSTTPCATCHRNNVYKGTPRDCYTCHLTDFQTATTPVPHTGFPTACDSCHRYTDTTWSQKSAFNHNTYFALAGAHVTAPCAQCHKNNNYLTVPTSPCSACHMADFQNATTPVPHTGFPTACDSCHAFADTTWSQKSTFRHNNYFTLAGAHVTAPCASCHKNNNYLTVPTSPCSACHMADYQNAISPVNHIAAGFPTTCDTCHKFSDTSWSQAVFNHTWFPRNHGNSGGVCSACHTNPSDYRVFSCTICHTAGQTSPPAHHNGVAGYVYQSQACYSCHPQGRH